MNAILGFADILRRGYESDESERREYLETIHSSGRHLLELINDILDLSKIEAGKLEIELGVAPAQARSRRSFRSLSVPPVRRGSRWNSVGILRRRRRIETDPTRLRQVITNLVGNAIKFTDHGSVRISARVMPEDSAMQIRISDTGIGMKPEVLGRIFTPFTQADNSITRRFGGTGLGLSISKQIVEALGGGIRVESDFGRGSTFTVTVGTGCVSGVRLLGADEVGRATAAATAAATTDTPAVRLPPCRVLLVEDGVSNRRFITLVLQRAGATVIDEAEDGRSGAGPGACRQL